MSLLTKTESSTIHAFLDTMDYENLRVSREWAMYAQHQEAEPYHDRSALAKATKDLMALDAPRYTQQQYYHHQVHPQQQQQPHYVPQYSHQYDHHPGPVYARQPTFPFLHQQRPPPPSPHPLSMNHLQQLPRPYTATPSTASTSSSSFSFPPDLPPSPVPRRPSPKHSASAPPAIAPKRPRTAPPPVKPALLSASQKKANHIQSEQKRRANIRRGYEALCESVPALRDAIREEEALSAMQHVASSGKGKRGRGRGRAEDGTEKIDGRAGPRSENVVLSKTIDYMNELLSEREALNARLDRARAVLPPGHPARTPAYPDPLWEREWKGGLGDADEDADEDEDDSS
ncbi:hypothetical protein FB451DRAFT_1132807 [Mycena latifolia]|nr:hypothetical protein FB451DRAFT_1132807 [Mycena latifolia]